MVNHIKNAIYSLKLDLVDDVSRIVKIIYLLSCIHFYPIVEGIIITRTNKQNVKFAQQSLGSASAFGLVSSAAVHVLWGGGGDFLRRTLDCIDVRALS